ncbi:MAG: hypothetical protein FWD91_02210 [Treponema sp.]|nr:hypothetical protein [Treponema sp.]
MKKSFLVLTLAVCVAGGVFAQSLFSIGAGGILNFGEVGNNSAERGRTTGEDVTSELTYGGFVFFDATFVDLSVAIVTGSTTSLATLGGSKIERNSSVTALDFTLLGKYPIALGDTFTFFPLLGLGYNYVLSVEYDNIPTDLLGIMSYAPVTKISAADWSAFRFHLGVGGDLDLSKKVYLRGQLLGSYRFASPAIQEKSKIYKPVLSYLAEGANIPVDASGGFGGTVKIAIGFRF